MRTYAHSNATAPDSPEVGRLAAFLRERWHLYRTDGLVARAEEGAGGGGDGGGSGEGGSGDGGPGDGEGGSGGDGGDDDGDGDDDDDGDPPELTVERRAREQAERQLKAERKARRQAERELKVKRDAERADAGEHEERITELQQENGELKARLGDGEYGRSVLAIATRLRYKHPELAERLLPRDLRTNAVDEDYEVDERMVEKALKDLTKQYDDLTKPEEKPQGRVAGDRDQRPGGGKDGNGGGSATGDEFNPRGNLRGGLQELMRETVPD